MSVAIIIPTYSHFAYAQLAIESAARTPGATLLVIDDGSPDWPSERIIRGWIPAHVPFIIQRYDKNAGSLTRSWNTGIRHARNLGCEYVVCGNADLVFPVGWWEPMEELFEHFYFVGPLTNAPGHSREQRIERVLPDYVLSDDPDDIDQAQREITGGGSATSRLNGFCFAGRVSAFDRLGGFNPARPMAGNEDDLFQRAAANGMTLGIAPSFVFHYRSVSRGLKVNRLEGGAMRLAGCGGCGKG
jgi:GT2 family glycosyltransferase